MWAETAVFVGFQASECQVAIFRLQTPRRSPTGRPRAMRMDVPGYRTRLVVVFDAQIRHLQPQTAGNSPILAFPYALGKVVQVSAGDRSLTTSFRIALDT